ECTRIAGKPVSGSSTSLNSDRLDQLPPRNEAALLDESGTGFPARLPGWPGKAVLLAPTSDLNSADDQVSSADADESPQAQTGSTGRPTRGLGGRTRSARSPDGKWTAFVRDQNIYLKPEADGQEIQLSTDGKSGLAYGMLQWTPDSSALVACRIEPGDDKE